jgi:cobalamin biosynthesis protein CobD/CbiB
MNKGQRVSAVAGLLLLALLGLFPPWTESVTAYTGYHQERPLGYGLLWSPPEPRDRDYSVALDYQRLAVSWAVVIFLAGVVVVLLQGRRKDQPR